MGLTTARIVPSEQAKAIEESAGIIRRGGLVAFPTETVYGLGADASNPVAVARIFEVKARPRIDPLIIHVADVRTARAYGRFPPSALDLMEKFWPGPLTLVVPRNSLALPVVTAGLETVAIRIPAHPAALALIRAAECGIAAPSANPFGYVSPTEALHVADQLADAVDLILDGGPCTVGVESTILSLVGEKPCILRPGGVTREELEAVLGKLESSTSNRRLPMTPGQLQRHYATHTPLEIVEEAEERLIPGERVGLLSCTQPRAPHKYASVEILSPTGNLREAAANLFGALRRLDSLGLDRLIARPVPDEGLGIAIMDRFRRCSAKEEHVQNWFQ